ncbi:zinc cadmium resistance protein [Zalerion maritima]|uniref:Zinc cadmium resistance protein n=1 Tax=Zalerion maritima TaxID=339359 RepID=A0AAD5RUK2_9PEZI|nr:zinc cadmium resistance protein [Zalerion maritima]
MGWSKTTRISVMLAIDIAFFALELGVGIYVGSLALLADAFHMLNDIISLLVGLWAVMVARKATSDKFTYGWLRAEILGAFFNAVFLIALCVSIILEAITRFIEPPEIKNPKLILIVGCLGLASNLVGFFVLGGHGHAHENGEEDHEHPHPHAEHSHEGRLNLAEQGYGTVSNIADDNGPITDVLPEVAVARANNPPPNPRRIRFSRSDVASDSVTLERSDSRLSGQSRGHSRSRLRSESNRHSRLHSIDDMSIHPASFRQEIIAASRSQQESSSGSSDESAVDDEETPDQAETSPLLANGRAFLHADSARGRASSCHSHRETNLHESHHHKKPKKAKKGGHGHSHDDMGMNAMILHVLGDALGNVGVIVTALIIWLTDLKGKYYADPAVSLFITLIILRSALPLTFATSKILLQATPDHLEVSEIREDIESLPGVVSCHHVHIWQLSDTQLVASMHIHVEFPISEAAGDSATIQPEFCTDDHHHLPKQLGAPSSSDAATRAEQSQEYQQQSTDCAVGGDNLCLLECVDNCAMQGCCRSATEGSDRFWGKTSWTSLSLKSITSLGRWSPSESSSNDTTIVNRKDDVYSPGF